MGTVYLAHNPDLPRKEALKVLAAELSRDPDFRARFVREADVAAGLDHPNIVSVHRRGEFESRLWIAMQFVDGMNAEDALRAGEMTAARAVHVVGEIAKALDYAHQRGVLHRDIKPANFLLSGSAHGDERVLLGDFGIARALDDAGLTATGSVLATLSFAAPEVLAGQSFDGRADLYSLGCTLFRLLTGEAPFSSGGGVAAVVGAHLYQPPPKVTDRVPTLSAAMDSVIAAAMAKDPAHRFASARELAQAAAAALQGHGSGGWTQHRGVSWEASPDSPGHQGAGGPATVLARAPVAARPRRLLRGGGRARQWILAASAAAAVVAVALAAVTLTSQTPRSVTPGTTTTPAPTTAAPAAAPPILTQAALPGLLPSPDDVKSFTGIQNLGPAQSAFRPTQNPNGRMSREECRSTTGGGSASAYDMRAAVGYYSSVMNEARDGTSLQMVGEVVVAFPDAAAAQRQLADSLSVWRQCGGSTMTLFGPPGSKPWCARRDRCCAPVTTAPWRRKTMCWSTSTSSW